MKLFSVFLSILFLACNTSKKSAGTEEKNSIVVLSYNIHHCNPPSKPSLIDVDTIAGVIRKLNPDIVALQEVDVNTGRNGKVDQAAVLAAKTGMKYHFFKAIDHDGGDYGVALLSKYELTDVELYRLPTVPESKGEPRVLGSGVITLNGRKIRVACTHLDAQSNPQNRLLQIKAITDTLSKSRLPVIIAGDLNATPESEVIKIFDQYFTRSCRDCAFTIPVINPNKTIDFVAYSPASAFSVLRHEVIKETYASDHLPVITELKLGK